MSVAAYRLFAPNEIFPVTYKRGPQRPPGRRRPPWRGDPSSAGRPARADRARGLPFGLSGSAGSTPLLRIQVQDGWHHPLCSASCTPRATSGPTVPAKLGRALLYGRLEDEKPFNTVKRLVQQEDYALALMARAGLPSLSRTVSPSSPSSGST